MPFEKDPTLPTAAAPSTLAVALLLAALSLFFSVLSCRLAEVAKEEGTSVMQSIVESESIVAFLGLDDVG